MTDERETLALTPRAAARIAAVQALYQLSMSENKIEDVLAEFVADHLNTIADKPADKDLFTKITKGVDKTQSELDSLIEDHLADGWDLSRLNIVSLNILRAATYELLFCQDVPGAVVINEYVNVAHSFLDKNDAKFINGVVDKINQQVREADAAS